MGIPLPYLYQLTFNTLLLVLVLLLLLARLCIPLFLYIRL